MPPDLFARVMAVNVTGVYNGVVTFAAAMRTRRSGHIVNTSSINGLIAYGSLAAYSASTFAVDGLSEALRDELAPFGIGVSVLYPGLTDGYKPGERRNVVAAIEYVIWHSTATPQRT